MKLRLDGTEKSRNYISSVEPGRILIREEVFTESLLIAADLLQLWPVQDAASMTDAALQQLIDLQPELIVLGTGQQHVFPQMDKLRPLLEAGIGYEIMSTPAACRTYNVLVAEDRNVLAGLILP